MRRAHLLRAVRRRLSDPKAWIKGKMAVDVRGKDCWGNDPGAVAWCVNGAIQAEAPVAFEPTRARQYERFRQTAGHLQLMDLQYAVLRKGYANTIRFNNAPETTHVDLLGMLDMVIAAYEADR